MVGVSNFIVVVINCCQQVMTLTMMTSMMEGNRENSPKMAFMLFPKPHMLRVWSKLQYI